MGTGSCRKCLEYAKRRPVSLLLLFLSGALAMHCIFFVQHDSVSQVLRDIVFVIFFPLSLALFIWKWRLFVALNVVALSILLAISILVLIRYVDPFMGISYVVVLLFLIGLLLRENHCVSRFHANTVND